jgi:uncharacterized membrane protein
VDVTLYEWLLVGHLLFAIAWVGGDVMLQALSLRALRARPERTVAFTADVEWVGLRVLTPAGLLVVAFGFGLVAEGSWSLSDFWILAGLVVWAISFLTGATFLGPETGRISRLAASGDPSDPEVQRRISRVLLFSRIELVLLILIVFDMVVKPGL